MSVQIRVETIAGCSVRETFYAMRKIANNLDCQVASDINDILRVVYPGQQYSEFEEAYNLRKEQHEKACLPNPVPVSFS